MKQPSNFQITLRPWQETDIPALIRHANNLNIWNTMMDRFPHPFAEENARWFIPWTHENNPPQILAIDFKGEAIGSIGLHPLPDVFRLNCELGYWVAEPCWGKGIATQAVQQMVAYAKNNFDYVRLFGRVFGNNPASAKVLEKAGFTLECHIKQNVLKNGVLVDELVYGLRL